MMIFSCSNLKVIPISEELKKINYYNSNGELTKTFYKKYDKQTDDWYVAKCDKIITNYKCKFTGVSINLINLRKEKDYQDQSNNNEQDQSSNNEQDQSNNNEQQQSNPPGEFFGFEGCLGCENLND